MEKFQLSFRERNHMKIHLLMVKKYNKKTINLDNQIY